MSRRISSTKHFHVSKILAERVKYMVPGDFLPTLTELMKEFDASQATISQALARLRSQGLVSRPSGKKRLIVSGLTEKSLFRIVLIRPTWPSPDFDAILYAIQQEGTQQHLGFNVFSYTSMDSLDIERAVDTNDAAFFIPSSEPFPDSLRRAIQAFSKPIIFLREKPERVHVPEVCVDDYNSGKAAVQHLAELGHRNILAITSEPPSVSTVHRLNGWKDAMRELNVPNAQRLFVDCSVRPGQYSITGAYESLRYWLASNSDIKFTAAFCISWTGALAAMRCFRESKIQIPDDVSIISCGGEGAFSDFLNPPLSTLEINVGEFARAAITMVQDILVRPKSTASRVITIKSFLIPRLSSRRCTIK
jgi:DNA-binding LacI/PurR family transcriptional regulator